jgi:DNA polymerase V
MELQGIPCAGLEEVALKQSILSSKSFGEMQTDFELIGQAISSHCTRAWEKLRQQKLIAQALTVFVQTNRFRDDLPQYCKNLQVNLINPTDDLTIIIKMAKLCFKKLYRAGYQYKKAGVCLEHLIPKNPRQLDLFHQPRDETLVKKEQLMTVFDSINRKFGRQAIRLAAEGNTKLWAKQAELKSPAYTTRWTDLAIVKNKT